MVIGTVAQPGYHCKVQAVAKTAVGVGVPRATAGLKRVVVVAFLVGVDGTEQLDYRRHDGRRVRHASTRRGCSVYTSSTSSTTLAVTRVVA
jgi:hypothetical protein